jgi:alpha-amylase/alpha-mannosidase (GH57 family)
MEKFICIHGHFYQPPRENAWLETVELQDSASPYHDWNERVTAECYAPNAYARFLDGEGRIKDIVSNYSKISFNFGPTLLSWMKDKAPDIHQAIVDADQASQKRFSGHGSALAQCYNHIIMPLANRRDKYTQALWGSRDFESRFGRKPEGMWLPETAADNESLDVLAELGIKFTILSPYQASRMRPLSGGDWQDVNGGRIDPSMPYLVKLPEGRSIAVFFYDAYIARAVAFERLLANGEHFAQRLTSGFNDSRNWDQIVNIATDGESYGHHSRFGEMALAYALHSIENGKQARLTIYGEYLATRPPTHEVEIHQGSAWSCSHGVGRWYRDCGCNSGGHSWNQKWREPLRGALDWLRDEIAPHFEKKAAELLKDPWAARDDYDSVILDRSPGNLAKFFSRHAVRELAVEDQLAVLRAMELQRHALLMYTSCGWFFDELSGLETVQVIQYAARVIELGRSFLGQDFEPAFLDRLALAKSNLPEYQDGRFIYEKFVKPSVMTRDKVAAHFAISSLFESYPPEGKIYAFHIHQHDRQFFTSGNTRMAIGRMEVKFEVTGNSDEFTYAAIYMGDHNLNCAVRFSRDQEAYQGMVNEMRHLFDRADFPEIIRLMDQHFGPNHYSVTSLFRDEQRKILNQILTAPREDIHHTFRLLTDRYAPLMRFLADIHAPVLKPLQSAMEVVLNSELRRQFESDAPDLERVRGLLAECQATKTPLDNEILGYALKKHLEILSAHFLRQPNDITLLTQLENASELTHLVPFETNLWKPQNIYCDMAHDTLPVMQKDAASGGKDASMWVEKFMALGKSLGFSSSLTR